MIWYTTQNQAIQTIEKLLTAHGYDPRDYDVLSIADEYHQERGNYDDILGNPGIIWAYLDDHQVTKTIHPGVFVQLKTGPYKTVLWGDEVNIPAFMVDKIEDDTVHCYYPPYSFKWPLQDLQAVERPAEYGANHDDWISEYRMAFTYATEYESTFEDE